MFFRIQGGCAQRGFLEIDQVSSVRLQAIYVNIYFYRYDLRIFVASSILSSHIWTFNGTSLFFSRTLNLHLLSFVVHCINSYIEVLLVLLLQMS